MSLKKNTSAFLLSVINSAQGLKAEDLIVLDLRETGQGVCDFFVLCTSSSSRASLGISREIEKQLIKNLNQKPYFVEGLTNAQWILMDYIDVVIHIFEKETRDFYKLEEFWGDAKKIDFLTLK